LVWHSAKMDEANTAQVCLLYILQINRNIDQKKL
jgi:hypothetical protein